nr:MAG TPA: hypothetical protein [Caudoviricetes sp.]
MNISNNIIYIVNLVILNPEIRSCYECTKKL